MHLAVNTLLQGGKYKIVRFISSGGFGCTYEAEHVMLEKRVAIKEFFVKDFCNRDETTAHVTVGTLSKKGLVTKLRHKFVDEAKALSHLEHKGIVKVSDVFEENGTAYFVMDYIDGRSLGEIVNDKGPLGEAVALKYIRQVAVALRYVHDHNRLHLDIKPGNIMIDSSDNAVLIDFGASKQYDEVEGENTSTLMGKTPGYAPLEQIGNDVVKFMPATDIYALGATLYKMLTGKTPPGANLLASGEPLEPLPGGISASTARAINEAMRINKRQRPQDINAFLAILDSSDKQDEEDDVTIIDTERKHAANEQRAQQESAPARKIIRTEPAEPERKDPEPDHTKRNVLIGAVVVIAIIVFFVTRQSSTPSDNPIEVTMEVTDMSYTNSKGVTFTYTGEVGGDTVPNGRGKGVYEYGTYEGDYKDGLREGEAVYDTSDGANHFEGTYAADEYGTGKLIFLNDGSYFEGTFKGNELWNGTYHDNSDGKAYTVVNGDFES